MKRETVGETMEFTLEPFANDTFKLLKSLKENQVKVKGDFYIPLSQQEILTLITCQNLKQIDCFVT